MATPGLKPPGFSTYGGALDYSARVYGGLVQQTETFLTMNTTAAQIVANNADRMGLLIMNTGSVQVFISLSNSPSSTQGILLAGLGGFFSTSAFEDLTLPSRGWSGIVTSGTSTLYVLEIVRILSPAQVPSL